MNSAPDWQDGECCFRCRTQFSLVARKHHCRNCGNIFCAKCSSNQIPLPKLNIDKNVRVCDTCYEKIADKNEDPLTLALSSKDAPNNSKSEQTKSKPSSSKSSTSKQSASAPSEQEIIEQEQLELALALSLSETPTKVSFPDCRHLEVASSNSNNNSVSKATTSATSASTPTASITIPNTTSSNNISQSTNMNGISPACASAIQPDVSAAPTMNHVIEPSTSVVQQPAAHYVHEPCPAYQMPPERDLEVFRYVGEIQQTLETFNNRMESCKLRNRPVTNDSAIQSLFIKLNNDMQPKLADFIKTFEDERADYERIQDKLSQIADARAALDALREEHQEKVRQQAAEAEKQRQSQLATKLEAMRQKKTQMMQYQRELALQRIREQEQMGMQHQLPSSTTQSYQATPATMSQPMMSNQLTFDPMQQMHSTQPPTSVHQQQWQPAIHQQTATQPYAPPSYVPNQPQYEVPEQQQQQQQQTSPVLHQQQQAPPQQQPPPPPPQQQPYVPPQPVIDRASLAQLERQFLPNTKPDEDTPLISFDD